MKKRLQICAVLATLALLLSGGAAGAADGTVLKTFSTRDGLPNDWVKAISTPGGKVCVTAGDAARGGSVLYDAPEGKFRPFVPGDGFRGSRVTSWVDFGGKSYVATEAALNVGGEGSWTALDRFETVQHTEELLFPAGSLLYAVAPVMYGGVLRFDGKGWSIVDRGRGTGIMNNATSLATKGEQLYIGTTTNGLFHFDGKGWKVVGTDQGLPSPWVTSVAVDAEGSVWLGTIGGLGLYDGDKVRLFGTGDGLASNKVSALKVIKDKLVVGTMDQGVSIRLRNQFINVGPAEGLSDGRVTALAASEEGAWVGTVNGLNLVEVR